MNVDWEDHADRLAHKAVNDGEPTRWFDELYSAGERGEVSMPWDRGTPNPTLSEWAGRRDGAGLRALVIGCGLGRDSEYLATLGYAVTAIDVAPTARAEATAAVARLVAPGGTLLVIASARDDDEQVSGPPWPLTRADIEAFAQHGLGAVSIEHLANEADPGYYRWRAEYETVGHD